MSKAQKAENVHNKKWARIWTTLAVLLLLFAGFKYFTTKSTETEGELMKLEILRTSHSPNKWCSAEVMHQAKIYYVSPGVKYCEDAPEYLELYHNKWSDELIRPGEYREYELLLIFAFIHLLLTFLPWRKWQKQFESKMENLSK